MTRWDCWVYGTWCLSEVGHKSCRVNLDPGFAGDDRVSEMPLDYLTAVASVGVSSIASSSSCGRKQACFSSGNIL